MAILPPQARSRKRTETRALVIGGCCDEGSSTSPTDAGSVASRV